MAGLRKFVFLVMLLCLWAIPYQALAMFDVMKEVDIITSEKDNIYTMYVNMPTEHFKNNFSALPGWGELQVASEEDPDPIHHNVTYTYTYQISRELQSEMVGETILAVTRNTNPNLIRSYAFFFNTKDKALAEQIYERAVSNFVAKFGGAKRTTSNNPNEMFRKFPYLNAVEVKTKLWYMDDVNLAIKLFCTKEKNSYRYTTIISRDLGTSMF